MNINYIKRDTQIDNNLSIWFFNSKENMKFKVTKREMTQIFKDGGKVIPVTVVDVIDDIDFDQLNENTKVSVSGKTIGRGFAGGIKRHGFKGGPRTHGQSDRQRSVGSVGAGTDPGRVFKGKRLPGHMGNEIKTLLGVTIVRVDKDKKQIVVAGSVPGSRKNLLTLEVNTDGN